MSISLGTKSGRAIVQAGWADAPWLGEEIIERMKGNTPAHLIEARMFGYPSIGSGNVYPIPLEEILIDPFEIPPHYKFMYGLDVGWNKTGALWAAVNPEDHTIYIYSEHYQGESLPELHAAAIKSRGEWMRGAIDPASRGRSQADGEKLFNLYKKAGLKILKAKNEVNAGVWNIWQLLELGKLKIFKNLRNFQREYMVYRRDEHGKIVKENDHLMDALRYIVNNIEIARPKPPSFAGLGAKGYAGKRYDL